LDIAEHIAFTHITVKNILREMEDEGLVMIKSNPDDRRSKLVSLSAKGKTLLKKLRPLWAAISRALGDVFMAGHPDIINILNRIDRAIEEYPIYQRVNELDKTEKITILDYTPHLKPAFQQLVRPWLLEVLNGRLEKEDEFVLEHPEKAYLDTGGFIFFARVQTPLSGPLRHSLQSTRSARPGPARPAPSPPAGGDIAGCIVLKRLSPDTFEFAKLYIRNDYRNLGIATRLIERCITRCKENEARRLWLQTTLRMQAAHKLYYKLGFKDDPAPPQMTVLARTEKIMSLDL
ncbi:MAG TPA: bifunctional helix-turn-helix transcriptional regulator/GNAT family N-acetyltransferase, partial [Puia sp.]|nr:bifunctional helix-turn-helix transcriptional regulator/GNAT family N-acetyltransferase [Puia sp.]